MKITVYHTDAELLNPFVVETRGREHDVEQDGCGGLHIEVGTETFHFVAGNWNSVFLTDG